MNILHGKYLSYLKEKKGSLKMFQLHKKREKFGLIKFLNKYEKYVLAPVYGASVAQS